MTQIIEVDESGALRLPPDAIGHARPHTRYVVQRQGAYLVVSPAQAVRPPRRPRTPEERAAAIRQWAGRDRPPAPAIPLEELRRERLYDRWTDARLAALMEAYDLRNILTLNVDDFHAFAGITVVHPRSVLPPEGP